MAGRAKWKKIVIQARDSLEWMSSHSRVFGYMGTNIATIDVPTISLVLHDCVNPGHEVDAYSQLHEPDS